MKIILFSFFIALSACYPQVTINNIQTASTITNVGVIPDESKAFYEKQGDSVRVNYWINFGIFNKSNRGLPHQMLIEELSCFC